MSVGCASRSARRRRQAAVHAPVLAFLQLLSAFMQQASLFLVEVLQLLQPLLARRSILARGHFLPRMVDSLLEGKLQCLIRSSCGILPSWVGLLHHSGRHLPQ